MIMYKVSATACERVFKLENRLRIEIIDFNDVPKVSSESCSTYQNGPNLIDEDKINQSMTLLRENPYLYDSVK